MDHMKIMRKEIEEEFETRNVKRQGEVKHVLQEQMQFIEETHISNRHKIDSSLKQVTNQVMLMDNTPQNSVGGLQNLTLNGENIGSHVSSGGKKSVQ